MVRKLDQPIYTESTDSELWAVDGLVQTFRLSLTDSVMFKELDQK